MSQRKITSLYKLYKDTPKKLKIICDWDEVIQACEPYAYWLGKLKNLGEEKTKIFPSLFKKFWNSWGNKKPPVEYSLYGSRLMFDYVNIENEVEEEELKRIVEQQIQIKNSSNFYQEAPFLTIAEDLLKLIKEDKIEQIIFLVYCKVLGVKEDEVIRDERIEKIFKETFGKFSNCSLEKINYVEDDGGGVEIQWSKTDWIKKYAPDFDIVIDDNPNICNSLVAKWFCKDCISKQEKWFEENKGKSTFFVPCENCILMRTVISPYYPATAKIATGKQEGYYGDVLLVKQEVSNLKKEDFK